MKNIFKNPFQMPLSYRIDKFLFPTFSWQYNVKWAICNFFNPKQKWLTKKISNSWQDKVELMRTLLFEMVVHFVEKEMEIVDWDATEGHQQVAAELREVYKYIKEERPALEKELDAAYPPMRNDWFKKSDEPVREVDGVKFYTYNFTTTEEEKKCYERVHEIEAKIDELDQKHLHTIINNRQAMWT